LSSKPDLRLNRQLTIQEFILAFGKYKRLMTTAFPARKSELDAYEEDVIEISNFYGHKFYDYHKRFAAKAATLLQDKHIKVDWSKRDRDLLSSTGAGVEINICKLCNMIDHSTTFCPLQLSGTIEKPCRTQQDSRSEMETKILTSEEEIDFSTMVKKFVAISIHQMVANISGVALSYTFAQNVVLPIMPNTLTREALHRLAPLRVQRLKVM
jgi:hypothetical protein